MRLLRRRQPDSYRLFAMPLMVHIAPMLVVAVALGANLRKQNLALPGQGRGEIHLTKAAPEIGEEWTDSRRPTVPRAAQWRTHRQ